MVNSADPAANLWAIRLAEFDCCKAAERQFHEGDHSAAEKKLDAEQERLAAIYGSWELARANPIGRPMAEAALKAQRSSEAIQSRLITATDDAAKALSMTAPPDFAGLLRKIAIIQERDLLECESLRPLDAIRQDIEALTA